MLPVLEEEVDAVLLLLHLHALVVHVVLQDHLFQEEQRLLVPRVLAQLHHRAPGVRRELLLAVLALLKVLRELDHEALLNRHALVDFLRNGELDLDAPRVRLRVEEARVDELHVLEPADLAQAERKELLALALGVDPGRALVAAAVAALVDDRLLGDALADVVLRGDAGQAEVGARFRGAKLCST